MLSIIKFLGRFGFQITFLFLFSFSYYLLIKYNKYQQTSYYTNYYEVSGRYFSFKNGIVSYLNLREANEQLLKENSYLRMNNLSSLMRREKGQIIINDTIFKQHYSYIPAQVINQTLNLKNNYIILNQGDLQGVKPEMGVISSNGIVGVVKHVSKNFCSVLTVLNNKTNLSGRLNRSEYLGRVQWTDKDNTETISLEDIPVHADVKQGDTVSTFLSSLIFPQGILVGTVKTVQAKPGENFLDIQLQLGTNFRKLSNVYIVNNLYKNEHKELEEKFVQEVK